MTLSTDTKTWHYRYDIVNRYKSWHYRYDIVNRYKAVTLQM